MPHYSDGVEAQVGDIVEGQNASYKNPDVGVVEAIYPNNVSCDMQIARLQVFKRPYPYSYGSGSDGALVNLERGATVNCKDYRKIGEVK